MIRNLTAVAIGIVVAVGATYLWLRLRQHFEERPAIVAGLYVGLQLFFATVAGGIARALGADDWALFSSIALVAGSLTAALLVHYVSTWLQFRNPKS